MDSSLNEKAPVGITVTEDDSHTKQSTLAPYESSPKPSLSHSGSEDDLAKNIQHPCPAARPASLSLLAVNPNDVDVEKGYFLSTQTTRSNGALSPLYAPCSQYSVGSRVKECTMWPSKQTLKMQAKQDKTRRRGNTCFGLSAKWGSLSRKQRNWIRVLLVLIVIAIAVGVAVGITKAVGGTVYGGKNGGQTIGN